MSKRTRICFILWVVPSSCKKPRALRFGDQTSAPTSDQMSPHVPTDHSILSNVPSLMIRLVSVSQCPTLGMAFVVKSPTFVRPPPPPPSDFTLIGLPDEFGTGLKFGRFGRVNTREPRNRMNLRPPNRTNSRVNRRKKDEFQTGPKFARYRVNGV